MQRIIAEPPEFLFYAVEASKVDRVFKQGLNRSKMASIALYDNPDKARRTIAGRKPVCVFAIVARVMVEDGYIFYRSEADEWLVDEIPSKYLRFQ